MFFSYTFFYLILLNIHPVCYNRLDMNPVLHRSLFVRFLLTPLLYFTRTNILHTILLLIGLDIIDCNPIVIKMFSKEYEKDKYCSLDKEYVLFDKIIDLIQNLVAILLLRPILPTNISFTLFLFLVYRSIGIVLFSFTQYIPIFILFFEFIKEYLVLYLLFGANIPSFYLCLGIVLKIIYEYNMHSTHFALKIYKFLFEK